MTTDELLALVVKYGYAEFDRGVFLAVRHDAESERAAEARKRSLDLRNQITAAIGELDRRTS